MTGKNDKPGAVKAVAVEFEAMGAPNGGVFWILSLLRDFLGYANEQSFQRVMSRAIAVCMELDLTVSEHFQQFTNESGKKDYRLTRFACYLLAMNGDVKKPQVARAQAYLASMAALIQDAKETAHGMERVYIRREISQRMTSLSSAAKSRKVEDYARFQNAGYMGMYNMNILQLRQLRGISKPQKTPLDFMGKRELAANLFRLTETESRILENEKIIGQGELEKTAFQVGKEVRDIMTVKPEVLALEPHPDIKDVKKGIKKTGKDFKKLDAPAKKPPRRKKRNE